MPEERLCHLLYVTHIDPYFAGQTLWMMSQ